MGTDGELQTEVLFLGGLRRNANFHPGGARCPGPAPLPAVPYGESMPTKLGQIPLKVFVQIRR